MNLIKFNSKWALVFIILICCILLFSTFLLKYKIEIYDNAILSISSDDTSKLLINSNIAYKIHNLPRLILKYDNKYHEINVMEISPTKDLDKFEMKVMNDDQWLIENTTINVTIIYDKKSILDYVF